MTVVFRGSAGTCLSTDTKPHMPLNFTLRETDTGAVYWSDGSDWAPDGSPRAVVMLSAWPTMPAASVERWDSTAILTRWDAIGDVTSSIVAPGVVELQAQSGAYTSKQRWDPAYDITLEGTLWAQDAPGSKTTNYFGGLALNGNVSLDNDYAEIAVQRNVQVRDTVCRTIALTQQGTQITQQYAPATDSAPFQPHIGRIRWVAAQKRIYYYIDELLLQFPPTHTFSGPVCVEVLCVSVPSGTSNDGSKAMSRFGPITVTGVAV